MQSQYLACAIPVTIFPQRYGHDGHGDRLGKHDYDGNHGRVFMHSNVYDTG